MILIKITMKRDTTSDFYNKHNMHAVEWKLNMIIVENPQLIGSLDRSSIYPLIEQYSKVPFND